METHQTQPGSAPTSLHEEKNSQANPASNPPRRA